MRIAYAMQLWHGASNPALVMQDDPLIIAAYAADCDAVLLVRFLPESVQETRARGIGLRPGTRLLSVNTYFRFEEGEGWKNNEIVLGPRQTGMWHTFQPFIAEFMCHEKQMEVIERRKREIPDQLWERTRQLGEQKIRESDLDEVRWGNPMFVAIPRSYRRAIAAAEAWGIPF